MDQTLPLFVIGGGPKAAALSAKAASLHSCNISAPPVWVLDYHCLAANWRGGYGFTNGKQRLGTPPEKDIGFPYRTDKQDPEVTQKLFLRHSWLARSIFKDRRFGEWVDRGRPHPTHSEWASYISAVITDTASRIIIGSIVHIDQIGDTWKIRYRENGAEQEVLAGGLVVTGPGAHKVPDIQLPSHHQRLLYGDDFWRNLDVLHRIDERNDDQPIVVVGGGETAASIVSYLASRFEHTMVPILVLTRSGTIFSRGEGYYENKMFTEHDNWLRLPQDVRREIIRRGDRGVFSVDVMEKISHAHNVTHQFMEVKSIVTPNHQQNTLVINGKIESQLVILALGFDCFSFAGKVRGSLGELLRNRDGQRELEGGIAGDLSVTHQDIRAKLYLPMAAGLAQGPGFPNLSCLGILSDRILGRING